MPFWSDLYRLLTFADEKDPLQRKKDKSQFSGAGTSQPDALHTLGADGASGAGGGAISYRQTNDMIDVTTLTNRTQRYKEYDRLRNIPEIEQVVTVIADEACVAGETPISTPFGQISLKKLTEEKAPDERFLVYCWDFEKSDYTLGWAWNPRKVKTAKTVRIALDDGTEFIVTPDHRILLRNEKWIEAGELKFGDELMPFYRIPANQRLTKIKINQFPRIFSHEKGWIHERQFVDEWKKGKSDDRFRKINKACRLIASGMPIRQIGKVMGHGYDTIENWIKKEGFSLKELRNLQNRNEDRKRVVGVFEGDTIDVYDLSVEKHMCFCTNSVIMHNCQKDETGNVFQIECDNDEVKKEVLFLLLHRNMLNLNRTAWNWFKNLIVNGDGLYEMVVNPDNPKDGIYKAVALPPESMYRIETTKGKLIEFQQSNEGPDYQALTKAPIIEASEEELNQSKAIRFSPLQIVHMRIGDDRKTFYPYGQSLIEPARGPAHQLRLMEDAMVVYRLCLVGDTRITLTNNSYKYIKDLNIGDLVYSYGESSELLPAKVTMKKNNGKQEIYRVRSRHAEIRGNATHPVLVNRKGVIQYVDIQDLIPKSDQLINVSSNSNNEIAIPRIKEKWAKLSLSQRVQFRNNKYKNISEKIRTLNGEFVRIKQFLYTEKKSLPYDLAVEICCEFNLDPKNLVIQNKGENNSERINTPEVVTPEFAQLFGFLLGDGFIHNGNQFGFAECEYPEVNKRYEGLMEKFFGKVRHEDDSRYKYGKYITDSKTACDILKELGFITGAKNKRMPNWAFDAKPEIQEALIKGLCEADGCDRETKIGTWYSTIELSNKHLIESIKHIWSSLGKASGHIKNRKRKGGHKITENRVMPSSESWSVTISECDLPTYENIISVERDGEEDVWDISVDSDQHNFIANGCPVHNTRAPERRVFYVDVGQLPPFKAEAFIDRLKDQFRKRKVASGRNAPGAASVEERWQPPAADEDFWLPIRPNSNTRIETLPGAQNLGEIDDAVYFRNKLFTALNFPKNYFSNEDPNATRITLSAQDVKFARMIERLQSHLIDGIFEICERHLKLRGFPEEAFDSLVIKMTPPSDWRELSRQEVVQARIANATQLKSGQLMADYDIYRLWMQYTENETEEMLSRLKLQKLEDLKLQVLAQNPALLGIGVPGPDGQQGQELGVQPGGPAGMPAPPMPGAAPPPPAPGMAADEPPEDDVPPEMGGAPAPMPGPGNPPQEGGALPEPEDEDIKKYDMEIQDYETEQDQEPIDHSTEE